MAGELRHYGAFVRSQPCAACGTPFLIEGHHALYGTTYSPDEPIPPKSIPNARKGASQVAHDWFLIPLCMRKCHTPGIHKNAGFFQGWSGAAIEAWEREQVTDMHRLYDAEFPNGDPAKAARASVTATSSRTTRKRVGAGWSVATVRDWLRREAPTRPAPVAAALSELADLLEADTLMTTRLRSIVKVSRQASGKTWAVGLFVPNEAYGGHRLDKVLAGGFESRKLAEQHAKFCRGGKTKEKA